MKRILITQRVDIVKEYKEKRDSLDQRWVEFLLSINYFPIVVPNNLSALKIILKNGKIDGILLSGGNTLVKYGGYAKERDEVDHYLLEFALTNSIPLIGVCRGMQSIQDYFSVPLQKIPSHVSTSHTLEVLGDNELNRYLFKYPTVMTYHEYGSYTSNRTLETLAKSDGGVDMVVRHNQFPILGLMWHPERNYPFSEIDKELFVDVYSNSLLELKEKRL